MLISFSAIWTNFKMFQVVYLLIEELLICLYHLRAFQLVCEITLRNREKIFKHYPSAEGNRLFLSNAAIAVRS